VARAGRGVAIAAPAVTPREDDLMSTFGDEMMMDDDLALEEVGDLEGDPDEDI
jgi:hypothetical protein